MVAYLHGFSSYESHYDVIIDVHMIYVLVTNFVRKDRVKWKAQFNHNPRSEPRIDLDFAK